MKVLNKTKGDYGKRERIICIILGIAAMALFAAGILEYMLPKDEPIKAVVRGGFGEGEKNISAVAQIQYKGNSEKQTVEFKVGERELSEEEKLSRLARCKEELPFLILAENESLNNIKADMNLIAYHKDSGVTLSWESSRPELINESGRVFPVENNGKKEGSYVLLTAALFIEGSCDEWKCNAYHNLFLSEENYREFADERIKELKQRAVEGELQDYFELPDSLGAEIKVKWIRPGENRFFFLGIIALIGIALTVYSGKNRLRNAEEKRKNEIRMEFPYFLDKLVMLLSAGVILTDALDRIAQDYKNYYTETERKLLYEELCISVASMKNSNSSFSEELTKLSERLDIREFARLAVILKNGLESGADLAEKLENESALMWNERKASVQRLGRLAETKLVFPLMIILGVLIVIVMTPAFMQM